MYQLINKANKIIVVKVVIEICLKHFKNYNNLSKIKNNWLFGSVGGAKSVSKFHR